MSWALPESPAANQLRGEGRIGDDPPGTRKEHFSFRLNEWVGLYGSEHFRSTPIPKMLYRTLTLQECPRFFRNLRQSPTWCRERVRDERYSQSLDAGTSICSVRFGVTTLRLDECNLPVLIKNEMFD